MRIRTGAIPALIAVLVLFSGCTSVLPGSDEATSQPSLDDVTMPPGVTENGTNTSTLADAHRSTLNDTSYTFVLESSASFSKMNQTYVAETKATPDPTRMLVNERRGMTEDGRTRTTYFEDGTLSRQTTAGDQTQYQSTSLEPAQADNFIYSNSGTSDVRLLLDAATYRPTGVREQNGTTYVVLTAQGTELQGALGRQNVSSFEATALADERGHVHSLEMTIEGTENNELETMTISMRYDDVGATTVRAPDWLEKATSQS